MKNIGVIIKNNAEKISLFLIFQKTFLLIFIPDLINTKAENVNRNILKNSLLTLGFQRIKKTNNLVRTVSFSIRITLS